MPAPNIEQAFSVSIKNYSNSLADNITKNTVGLAEMKKEGAIKTVSGGTSIVEQIEYAFNGSASYYTGAEPLSQAINDFITSAEFDWKQAVVNVTQSGLETLMNSGKEQLIDLFKAKIKNAEKSMANLVGTSFYGDGTAFSGKEPGGLRLLVPDNPTTGTVGGINRATWTFWRTKKFGGVADGGAAVTKANIIDYMERTWILAKRGVEVPKKIFADSTYFNLYWSALSDRQQIIEISKPSAIRSELNFMGSSVMLDELCPSAHMYFINTDYLKFRPHVDRNFVPLAKRDSFNQDVMTQYIVFAGNFTISAPYHSVLIA